jgi:hypothetical protein
MIRRDLWNQTQGPSNPGYMMDSTNMAAQRGWDSWKWNPRRNPSLQKATTDDILLEENNRRHQLAQELKKREDARKAKEEADMLEALISRGGGYNLYDEPANEQDERLQQIIQEDYDAGQRGFGVQVADARRQRKEGFENLNYGLKARDQALDRAKFADAMRRGQQDYRLDAARIQQQGQYRNAMLQQRDKQMALDYAQQGDQNYQREAKLALDLVKDGMPPEEVASLFPKLNKRDQSLLFSYGGMMMDEEDESAGPMLDYLNEMEMQMRRGAATPAQPGFFKRMMGGGQPAVDPSQMTRAQLPPVTDDRFNDLRLEAAKMGLAYDPNEGFYMPDVGDGPPPAEMTQQPQPTVDPRIASLPVVATREDVMRLPKGARFRTRDGRVMIKR